MATYTDDPANVALLVELEPVVAVEVNRHLTMAKEWMPHEYVPWSEGRTFGGVLDGEPWEQSEERFSDAARTSLIVNLLTEDNLPSYHREISRGVGGIGNGGAWATWVGRWTAEEGRHGQAIRDYLLVTRSVDPVALERMRMTHMTAGFTALHDGVLHGVAYVSFQELATRVSHRNTGIATNDPIADQLLQRIAADENLHMIFYRNVMGAAIDLQPDRAMRAITDTIKDFAMPGYGIEGFGRMALQIAVEGIYDLRQHKDDVLAPVLRHWRIFERTDFGPEGEQAREELAAFLESTEQAALRFEDKRDAFKARLSARAEK